MSQSQTTLQEDFNYSLRRAMHEIDKYPYYMNLLRSLRTRKNRKMTGKNARIVNRLAQLGVVTLYMDGTYSLSRLGERLLVNPKKISEP